MLSCFGAGHLLLGALTLANTRAEVGAGQWVSALLALGLAVAWANIDREARDADLVGSAS